MFSKPKFVYKYQHVLSGCQELSWLWHQHVLSGCQELCCLWHQHVLSGCQELCCLWHQHVLSGCQELSCLWHQHVLSGCQELSCLWHQHEVAIVCIIKDRITWCYLGYHCINNYHNIVFYICVIMLCCTVNFIIECQTSTVCDICKLFHLSLCKCTYLLNYKYNAIISIPNDVLWWCIVILSIICIILIISCISFINDKYVKLIVTIMFSLVRLSKH